MVGSSLSGAFEEKLIFNRPIFNLYLPVTGPATGIEIIRRSNKIPGELFLEINHIDRGIDTILMKNAFDEPLYTLKFYLPSLLKKNKALPNIIDRIKPPHNTIINAQRPPAILYENLLTGTRKRWSNRFNKAKIIRQFDRLAQSLEYFSSKGCKIIFYEMPMDSSLNNSSLLTYERDLFLELAAKKEYEFIKADTSRNYNTGDGEHLLTNDANIYVKYFLSNYKKL